MRLAMFECILLNFLHMNSLVLSNFKIVDEAGTVSNQGNTQPGLRENIGDITRNQRQYKTVVLKKVKKYESKVRIKKKKKLVKRKHGLEELTQDLSPLKKAIRLNQKKLVGGNETEPLRYLSPFTILSFPNLSCNSSDATLDGTCYTSSECSAKGGKSLGSCALGFGVCCIFNLACFSESSENGTIFTSPNTILPLCSAMIRFGTDICQVKLELEEFVLLDPDAEGLCTEGDYLQIFGGAVAATSRLPLLCGTSSGQHMYFTVMQGLPIGLQIRVDTARTSLTRSWKIVVYHYACGYENLPPEGCLQYFTGTSGTVSSFNFKTGVNNNNPGTSDGYSLHLSSTRYSICVRREEGYCSIAWSQTVAGAGNGFSVSTDGFVGESSCSGDYITIIDGYGAGEEACSRSRYCGLELKTAGGSGCSTETAGTVYSKVMPFLVEVVTDSTETSSTPSDTGQKGFFLSYQQLVC
jgi:hypothetical protein